MASLWDERQTTVKHRTDGTFITWLRKGARLESYLSESNEHTLKLALNKIAQRNGEIQVYDHILKPYNMMSYLEKEAFIYLFAKFRRITSTIQSTLSDTWDDVTG